MPDDLTLRLRTAKAVGWVLKQRCEVGPGMAREEWHAPDGRYCPLGVRDDGTVFYEEGMPDYPADLGACAEVLAAIEARKWWWKAWSCDDHAVFMIYNDDEECGPFSTNADGPLPKAICLAFCKAVEASRE